MTYNTRQKQLQNKEGGVKVEYQTFMAQSGLEETRCIWAVLWVYIDCWCLTVYFGLHYTFNVHVPATQP